MSIYILTKKITSSTGKLTLLLTEANMTNIIGILISFLSIGKSVISIFKTVVQVLKYLSEYRKRRKTKDLQKQTSISSYRICFGRTVVYYFEVYPTGYYAVKVFIIYVIF